MYVYWFKPLTRPFHDSSQPDDRPVMTFDFQGRMGNGGDDILSDQPRRIVAYRISDSPLSVTYKGKTTSKRYWFRRTEDIEDVPRYNVSVSYDIEDVNGNPTRIRNSIGERYRVAVKSEANQNIPGPTFELEDGLPVYPSPLSKHCSDDLKSGFVTILGNYGQRPFYSLSGDTIAAEERITVSVKGPFSSSDIPELVRLDGVKDPQEYTEILANKAWDICANTWTSNLYGEGS